MKSKNYKREKQKRQALTFTFMSGLHLMAGFKAKIRAGQMKNEQQLTTIALIKAELIEI